MLTSFAAAPEKLAPHYAGVNEGKHHLRRKASSWLDPVMGALEEKSQCYSYRGQQGYCVTVTSLNK